MKNFLKPSILALLAALGIGSLGTQANASLVLTSAGAADGFSLSTVANFSTGNTSWGILGLASNGTDITAFHFSNSTNYVFPDANNQTLANAISTTSAIPGGSNGQYVSVGGVIYGMANNALVAFNADGSVNHVLASGISVRNGLTVMTNGNLLFQSSTGAEIEVNPVTNTYQTLSITVPTSAAGASLSANNAKLYVASYSGGGGVTVYDTATGNQLINYAMPSSLSAFNAIGISAPLMSGPAMGSVLVSGLVSGPGGPQGSDVLLLNLSTGVYSVIATGTQAITYISQDPADGSYLLGGSNNIYRISPTTSSQSVPEPSGLLVLAMALGLLTGVKLLAPRRYPG